MSVARLGATVLALLVVVAAVVSTASTGRARAESPWVVFIELDASADPIVVDNWPPPPSGYPLRVVDGSATKVTSLGDLKERPYFRLKLLYGDRSLFEGVPALRWDPGQLEWDIHPLTVFARFYPAAGAEEPALFVVWDDDSDAGPYRMHRASQSDLVALSEAGVPVDTSQIDAGDRGGVGATAVLLALGGVLALVVVLAGAAVRVRRS